MNIKDVSKREVLDFKSFRSKVHDEKYKPLEKKNQKDSSDKTGLSKVKREPAFDFVGYADAAFGKTSGIEIPGYNQGGKRRYTIDNASPSIVNQPNSAVSESEGLEGVPTILKIGDFDILEETQEEIQESSDSELNKIEDKEDSIIKLSDFNS